MSKDWDDLADYHASIGTRGFDADAKNWDASLHVKFLEACAHIANRVYKALDRHWCPEHDVVRSALHSCVESPYILYNGKVIQTPGGQVSGQPGTAFDNSLINWMLCYIIYKRTMKEKGRHDLANFHAFMKFTRLSVYGDDMMITLAKEVLPHFDLNDYIKHAAEFGITITPADKDSTGTVHLHLSEMSFLKRKFVKVGKQYVGPIERESIGKALKWIRGPGSYVPKRGNDGQVCYKDSNDYGLFRENAYNQLREAALHGEEDYQLLHEEVNNVLEDLGMDPITMDFVGAMAENGVLLA